MTPEQYMDFVFEPKLTKELPLSDACNLGGLGIAGEAGEVADLMKKRNFHGTKYDENELILELGDVLWYMFLIMGTHNITLDKVMRRNVVKLINRYPEDHRPLHEWQVAVPGLEK